METFSYSVGRASATVRASDGDSALRVRANALVKNS